MIFEGITPVQGRHIPATHVARTKSGFPEADPLKKHIHVFLCTLNLIIGGFCPKIVSKYLKVDFLNLAFFVANLLKLETLLTMCVPWEAAR